MGGGGGEGGKGHEELRWSSRGKAKMCLSSRKTTWHHRVWHGKSSSRGGTAERGGCALEKAPAASLPLRPLARIMQLPSVAQPCRRITHDAARSSRPAPLTLRAACALIVM